MQAAFECGPDCKFDTNRTKEHLLHHVKAKIPTLLYYEDVDLVPTRRDFIDPKMRDVFAAQVQKKAPILFMPNDIIEKNDPIDGQMKYRIYLTGILPCGSKTMVILDGIDVHVDIMVPNGMDPVIFNDFLKGQMTNKNIPYSKISDVHLYRLKGFQKAKRIYKRVFFNTLQERKKMIEFIIALNREYKAAGNPPGKEKIETAADDTGRNDYYFPKLARELRFATADWNRIEKYVSIPAATYSTNCDYVFRVDIKDLKKLDKKKRAELLKPSNFLANVIDRDNTFVTQWDIETWREIQNGMVPTPADADYVIFMMCSAFFLHHSMEPLMTVCCVDTKGKMRQGMSITIECGTERQVLMANMRVWGKMASDIMSAFNGASFDWPLYREKCRREELLVKLKQNLCSLTVHPRESEAAVLKWNFKSEKIKIDAETQHHSECVAKFPGIIDTDVLPIFLKMYPKAEVRKAFSLNFFLAKNGLESKEDMNFKTMFKIYERSKKFAEQPAPLRKCHCSELRESNASGVTHPCIICKEKVPEIDCKKNPDFTPNSKEPEYLTLLHDDLMEMDTTVGGAIPLIKCCCCGKRERNLDGMRDVGYYCTIDCVRPQQLMVKRAIVPDKRELAAMSYVSLYDSFYRADGMKVRNVIGSYCYRNEIAFSNAKSDKSDDEKDHYPGAWVFPPERGLHARRPITGLDFASLYPSLMMTYNFSPDMVVYTKEEAEALEREGYTLHHIKPFAFERGKEKGGADNKHLTVEGWTVRHNGILNIKKNKRVVSEFVKKIMLTYKIKAGWVENVGGEAPTTTTEETTRVFKFSAKDGPCAEDVANMKRIEEFGSKPARRVVYDPVEGRAPLPGERMGIFAFIVKKLFDKRVPIKAEFVRLSKLLEQMEVAKVKVWTVKNPDGTEYVTTMADVKFQIAKVDAKQKAVKVLANTFYGESGNYRSSIYELLVAAGITCAGQENIKRVAEFITSKGFGPKYGDTDSIYTYCPESVYVEADAKFQVAMQKVMDDHILVPNVPVPTNDAERAFKAARVKARIDYWTEMVAITMKVMNAVKEDVSDYLLSNNGTCFLNMAYEEVGFPTVLCGKKKYFLTPHIETINFYPKEAFIRGIDIVKQGQTKISKMLGEEFIKEACSPENERELIDIAEDKIRKFFQMKLDPNMFALSAKYNPTKKNIPVLKFVERMKEMQQKYKGDPAVYALYEPPEPGDKFTYVVVKKEQKWNLQGKKIELKKGDRMEFLRVYNESQNTPNPMELDLNEYVKNAIVGIFARFIAYHPKFQPPADKYDITDKEQYKSMDKDCVDAASKYLEELCDSITGFDKHAVTQRGRDYRKIYNNLDKKVRGDLQLRYGSAASLLYDIDVHDTPDDARARSTRIVEQIKARAKAESVEAPFGVQYVKECATAGISPFRLKRIYSQGVNGHGIAKTLEEGYRKREAEIIEKLFKIVGPTSRVIYNYEKRFISLVDDMRKEKTGDTIEIDNEDLNVVNGLSEEEKQNLNDVHDCMMDLITVYRLQNRLRDTTGAIELARVGAINEPLDPKINAVKIAKDESKRAEIVTEYQWN